MPRVHIPDGEDLIQHRLLAQHQPAYLKPWAVMKDAVYEQSILPFEVGEMIRYRLSHINGCMICQGARVPSAKDGRLLDEALYDNILSWRTSDLYPPQVKAGIEFAEKFALDHHSMDDDYFEGLRKHFTDSEIVDLTYLTGRHMAFGRLTHVLGLDDSCEIGDRHSYTSSAPQLENA